MVRRRPTRTLAAERLLIIARAAAFAIVLRFGHSGFRWLERELTMPGRTMLIKEFMSVPMIIKRSFAVAVLLMAPLAATRAALPRFPQPFGDRIVFVANGNVWSVARKAAARQCG